MTAATLGALAALWLDTHKVAMWRAGFPQGAATDRRPVDDEPRTVTKQRRIQRNATARIAFELR